MEPSGLAGRAARGLLFLAAGLACVYLIDAGALHFRKDATATVTVRTYYAVPRNDKRVELMYNDPWDEPCVNAIFPHDGKLPCWYLRRYPEKRISL